MVSEPNFPCCPTFTSSTVLCAFTLSSTCTCALPCGCQVSWIGCGGDGAVSGGGVVWVVVCGGVADGAGWAACGVVSPCDGTGACSWGAWSGVGVSIVGGVSTVGGANGVAT